MKAICTIRDLPAYRRDAFDQGLRRAGYSIVTKGQPEDRRDLLVLWNFHFETVGLASTWERSGGSVVVCENGYAGVDEQARQLYAMAVHGHNGSGWHHVGETDRFARLKLSVQPFRTEGRHLLVCGQRGIGSKIMASPANWHSNVHRLLGKSTDRPIVVRAHPGNKPAPNARTLEQDLQGAWACVIWSSSSGVKSLLRGIPVFYDAPHWVCSFGAQRLDGADFEHPSTDDAARREALHRMSWAQRTVAEIESGEPFDTIRDNVGNASW